MDQKDAEDMVVYRVKEAFKKMIEFIKNLKIADSITKEGKKKQEVRNCFREIKKWSETSPQNLAVCCALNSILLERPERDMNEPFALKTAGIEVFVGKEKELPNNGLLLELERKTVVTMSELIAKKGYLEKFFDFIYTTSYLARGVVDVLFRVDLLQPKSSLLTLLEKIFCIYFENLENDRVRSSAATFLTFFLCEDAEFRYRNRKEWISGMMVKATEFEDVKNLLYEIFYLLVYDGEIDNEIRIVKTSEFNSSCEDFHSIAIKWDDEPKSTLHEVLYCSIPDEFMGLVTCEIIDKARAIGESIREMYNSYTERESWLMETAAAMWDEITTSPHKALRDDELDQIGLSGDLFNEVCKMLRIAFCTEGYNLKFPEVYIHFLCQRAHVEYDYYGKLGFIEVDDEKGEKKKVIDLLLPMEMPAWYKNILRFVVVDAYHSIVVKNKSKIEYKSPRPSGQAEDSQAHYIFTNEKFHIQRGDYRKLPELFRKDGEPYQARWAENPKRYEECMKRFKGKIPEGHTFVTQHKRRVHTGPNHQQEEYLFCYRQEDILSSTPQP